jgi:hypothetical protein
MKRFLAILSAICCMGAHAAEWNLIGVSDGISQHLDLSSIRIEGRLLKAWIRHQWATPQFNDGQPYQSLVSLMLFDCRTRRSGAAQIDLYEKADGRGKIVLSWRPRSYDEVKFEDQVPESMGSAMLRTVCSTGKP